MKTYFESIAQLKKLANNQTCYIWNGITYTKVSKKDLFNSLNFTPKVYKVYGEYNYHANSQYHIIYIRLINVY